MSDAIITGLADAVAYAKIDTLVQECQAEIDALRPAPTPSILEALHDISQTKSLMVTPETFKAVKMSFPVEKPDPSDNPLLAGYTMRYAGVPVHVADIPLEEVLDWSECRSPSRSKRRHAQGIKTRVRITYREVAYLIDTKALSMRLDRMLWDELYGRK